jgi:hypothetical protein
MTEMSLKNCGGPTTGFLFLHFHFERITFFGRKIFELKLRQFNFIVSLSRKNRRGLDNDLVFSKSWARLDLMSMAMDWERTPLGWHFCQLSWILYCWIPWTL